MQSVRGDKLLTTHEAAEVLRVAPHTVQRWVREGRLRVDYRTLGGRARFSERRLRVYMLMGGRHAILLRIGLSEANEEKETPHE